MNQIENPEAPHREQAPRPANRLSIAHLLLWTATTALVFSCCERPPRASEIGFASFLSQPGANVEAAMDRERQRLWRILQNHYLLNLAFAPIYGFALAGLALAGWRTAHAKPGFPNQPGHWLLVAIGSTTALAIARVQTPLFQQASGALDSLLMLIVAAIFLLTGIKVGQCIWQGPLFIFAGSVLLVSPLRALPTGPGSGTLVGIALAGVGAAFVLGLFCVAGDLARRNRGDLFHWIGVATLLGVVGHLTGWFLAAWL